MLSWGVLKFKGQHGTRAENAKASIQWATNYFYNCATTTPRKLYVGVSDPYNMDTPQIVYFVSPSNLGSDVAAEAVAALATASMVFQSSDRKHAYMLLETTNNVMQFCVQHRGAYSDSLIGFFGYNYLKCPQILKPLP
ncbi:Endoglucanase 9 [Bienertia sinuspersici]